MAIRKAYILDGRDPNPIVNRVGELIRKVSAIDALLKNDFYTVFRKNKVKRLKSLREKLLKRASSLVGKLENYQTGYWHTFSLVDGYILIVEIFDGE
ncbi:hypothetical protein BAU67_001971 [Escherichia coli]|nr:hypothetical protein [Escherichia coli]